MSGNTTDQPTLDKGQAQAQPKALDRVMFWIGCIGGCLGLLSLIITLYITLYDRLIPPSAEVVGLVPVDVYLKTEDKTIRSTDHGISFVVRVQNGSRPTSLGVLEIEGKVRLEISEYTGYMHYPEGTALEEVDKHYRQRKPFRFISWVGWPSNELPFRLEPHEERFLRYTVLDAELGKGLWARRAPLSDYVGFDDGTKSPKWVDEFPEAPVFFVGAVGPTLARDVREDVKNGGVTLRLRVGSELVEVSPSKIQGIRRVPKEDWSKAPAQDIYFGKNYWKSPEDTIPFHD